MSDSTNTATPEPVLIELLRLLIETVNEWEESLVPVLRGSLLLRHWFGDAARPAADIDLECFEDRTALPIADEDMQYLEEGFGRWGEYTSLVDFGKAMCRYAVEGTQTYQWGQGSRPEIEFPRDDVDGEGGESLWTYGTPGERYFSNWVWHERGLNGRLQIDIAQPGECGLDDIDMAEIHLVPAAGKAFPFPAYTPEMLLAAKLSWLLRSLQPGESTSCFHATWEPKDLFDAHLLLTRADLDAARFQKSLVAVGLQDDLDWHHLDVLLATEWASVADATFAKWQEFRERYESLIEIGPGEMLHVVTERLKPLLGYFYRPEERPFLESIHADTIDESAYLIYADWLEERGDARSEFLRLFTSYYFHDDDPAAIRDAWSRTSAPWLHRLFGRPEALRDMRIRIADQ